MSPHPLLLYIVEQSMAASVARRQSELLLSLISIRHQNIDISQIKQCDTQTKTQMMSDNVIT